MRKFVDKRRTAVVFLVTLIVSICLLVTLQTHAIETIRMRVGINKVDDEPAEEKKPEPVQRPFYDEIKTDPSNKAEKLAYVTFLSGTVDQDDDLENDNYFVAVRILVWQLLHNPDTRTKHDVVVMVTPTVSQARRDRLKKDGATVYPVEFLHTDNDEWIKAEQHRWDDVLTKMRVWEMTQYSRILMLDGDTMLRSSLDGVFDDPGAQILRTKDTARVNYTALPGEAALPETYLLASITEVWDSSHEFPPGETTGRKRAGYMNAGFFLLAPSIPTFKHYKSVMNIPDAFDPKYPEQNLMNFINRWDGPMPWREVAYTWNIRCPNENDFKMGLTSAHEKWWTQPYIYENQEVKNWLLTRRYEMKGWYDAWELKNA